MSGTIDDMNRMGVVNKFWGVCGFTSTFYSMYELNPAKRPLLINAGIATRVLAEIKTYLVMLQAEGKFGLLKEIEAFTQSFGVVGKCDFSKWTIDGYIKHINTAVDKDDATIQGDCSYSIGMPPQGVADYVTRMWEYKAEVQVVSGGSGDTGDGIIGVSKGLMPLYDGLCHYMYRLNGKIYSWGKQFNSVAEANAQYKVVRLIKISP